MVTVDAGLAGSDQDEEDELQDDESTFPPLLSFRFGAILDPRILF